MPYPYEFTKPTTEAYVRDQFLEYWDYMAQNKAPALRDEAWNTIHTAYTDPSRKYYTLSYLEVLLCRILNAELEGENVAQRRIELRGVPLFKDIVRYRTAPWENVARSIEMGAAFLDAAKARPGWISRLSARIEAVPNQRTFLEDDPDGALMVDIDRLSLAADESVYIAHVRAVREERIFSSREDYWRRRLKNFVLPSLQRPSIYKTGYLRDVCEYMARPRLEQEKIFLEEKLGKTPATLAMSFLSLSVPGSGPDKSSATQAGADRRPLPSSRNSAPQALDL